MYLSRLCKIAQPLYSYSPVINRDAAGLPAGYTSQMSGLLSRLIVRFMIQGSVEPPGNVGEPLRFTVVNFCAGAAQPGLSYPPPPRLYRFLNPP